MLQLVPLSITLAGRKPRAESRAAGGRASRGGAERHAAGHADPAESRESKAESRAAAGRAR